MNSPSTAGLMRLRLVAVLAALTTALAALGGLPAAHSSSVRTYVVDAGAQLPPATRVLGALPLAEALLVSSPVAIPGAVAADTPLQPEALSVGDGQAAGGLVDSGVAATGAPQVWNTTRGERAVVALVDTGVAPVPALNGAVAGEIDFTGTGGGDGHGHGTFLASLIAGRGAVAPGVAPGAGILSLKVGGPDGASTLASVMTALEWLHGPGRQSGIRVATLALGVEPGSEAAEIVDRGVDALAEAGVLVVTAAGNDGPGTLTSPATATGSLSVGSVDDRGTAERADDAMAEFSGTGPDTAGVAQPDVVASGVSVVGSLPEGSVVARGASADAHGLYSGSGTSMSTALAAGVAALASSARPDLGGPQLEAALRAGGGELDAPAAVAAALDTPAAVAPDGDAERPGRGRGTNQNDWPGMDAGPGDEARAAAPGQNRAGTGNDSGLGNGSPVGRGNAGTIGDGLGPESVRWTSVRWTSVRWTSVRWTSVRWTGNGWGEADWVPEGWASVRWTGDNWQVDLQSVRWTSVRWTSVRWTSVRWTSVRWTSVRWT